MEDKFFLEHTNKILLINGPTSSGKTTLMNIILKIKSLSFQTIARKKILYHSRYTINKKFFHELEPQLLRLTGLTLSNIEEIFLLKLNLSQHDQIAINTLKTFIIKTINENSFNEIYFNKVYENYLLDANRTLLSNNNSILDENLYSHPLQKDIFTNYFKNYIILCLYSSLNELLDKSIIRNEKYLSFLEKKGNANLALTIKDLEMANNSSEFNFREPIKIIASYMKFFKFEKSSNLIKDANVIESISQVNLLEVIDKIIETNRQYSKKLAQLIPDYLSDSSEDPKILKNILIHKLNIDLSQHEFHIIANYNFNYLVHASSLCVGDSHFNIQKIEKIISIIIN